MGSEMCIRDRSFPGRFRVFLRQRVLVDDEKRASTGPQTGERTYAPGGKTLNSLFEPTVTEDFKENGWLRLRYKGIEPKEEAFLRAQGCITGWHGQPIACLYSTCCIGALTPSVSSEDYSTTVKQGSEGVYCMTDVNTYKAEQYSPFIKLFDDECFYRIKWEILVHPNFLSLIHI